MSRPIVVVACMTWLLRIVGALTAPISVAPTCRWRSRPQHHERTSRLRFLASGSTPNRTKRWIGTALMRRTVWDDSRFSHEIGRRYRQFPDQALGCEINRNTAIERLRNEPLEHNVAKACARWRGHSWPAAFNPVYEKLARFRAVIFKRPRNRNPSSRNRQRAIFHRVSR